MPDILTASVEQVNAVRLKPPQIVVYWPLLRKAIAKAIERVEEPTLANIFDNLIEGPLDLWLLSSRSEDPKPVGVVLGGMSLDLLVGYRNYVIYGAYALVHVEDSCWKAIFTTIEKWARSLKCNRIVAYTRSPRVLQIAELIGGTAEVRVLEKELSNV